MNTDSPSDKAGWSEETSLLFIDYGRYFVPERLHQMRMIAALLSYLEGPGRILGLCCGEGLLAEVLLESLPGVSVHGLDGSAEMRQRARGRLARFWFLDPEDIDKPSPLYDQLTWLEQAGFVGVDVHWMLAGHAIFSGWKPSL